MNVASSTRDGAGGHVSRFGRGLGWTHRTKLPSSSNTRMRYHCASFRERQSMCTFGSAATNVARSASLAQRILGAGHEHTLRMRWNYARVLYENTAAALDDLREAMTTLEEIERIARRVFGGAHPLTSAIEEDLKLSRAALRTRETPSSSRGA